MDQLYLIEKREKALEDGTADFLEVSKDINAAKRHILRNMRELRDLADVTFYLPTDLTEDPYSSYEEAE